MASSSLPRQLSPSKSPPHQNTDSGHHRERSERVVDRSSSRRQRPSPRRSDSFHSTTSLKHPKESHYNDTDTFAPKNSHSVQSSRRHKYTSRSASRHAERESHCKDNSDTSTEHHGTTLRGGKRRKSSPVDETAGNNPGSTDYRKNWWEQQIPSKRMRHTTSRGPPRSWDGAPRSHQMPQGTPDFRMMPSGMTGRYPMNNNPGFYPPFARPPYDMWPPTMGMTWDNLSGASFDVPPQYRLPMNPNMWLSTSAPFSHPWRSNMVRYEHPSATEGMESALHDQEESMEEPLQMKDKAQPRQGETPANYPSVPEKNTPADTCNRQLRSPRDPRFFPPTRPFQVPPGYMGWGGSWNRFPEAPSEFAPQHRMMKNFNPFMMYPFLSTQRLLDTRYTYPLSWSAPYIRSVGGGMQRPMRMYYSPQGLVSRRWVGAPPIRNPYTGFNPMRDGMYMDGQENPAAAARVEKSFDDCILQDLYTFLNKDPEYKQYEPLISCFGSFLHPDSLSSLFQNDEERSLGTQQFANAESVMYDGAEQHEWSAYEDAENERSLETKSTNALPLEAPQFASDTVDGRNTLTLIAPINDGEQDKLIMGKPVIEDATMEKIEIDPSLPTSNPIQRLCYFDLSDPLLSVLNSSSPFYDTSLRIKLQWDPLKFKKHLYDASDSECQCLPSDDQLCVTDNLHKHTLNEKRRDESTTSNVRHTTSETQADTTDETFPKFSPPMETSHSQQVETQNQEDKVMEVQRAIPRPLMSYKLSSIDPQRQKEYITSYCSYLACSSPMMYPWERPFSTVFRGSALPQNVAISRLFTNFKTTINQLQRYLFTHTNVVLLPSNTMETATLTPTFYCSLDPLEDPADIPRFTKPKPTSRLVSNEVLESRLIAIINQ